MKHIMNWYFIFETDEGDFAIIETDKERAIAMAYEMTEFDGGCELIDEFPADNIGDDMIDAMGLDVY